MCVCEQVAVASVPPCARRHRCRLSTQPRRLTVCTATHVLLALDHGKVELILVARGGLLAQALQAQLLALVIACTQHVVLVLLEQAELLAVRQLRALLVLAAVDDVAQCHGGQDAGLAVVWVRVWE